MKLRTTFAAIALICAAFDNGALTLGRIRGAAVFGQPLDVVVQIETDGGEEAAAQCFEVEVFYADVLQNGSQVQLGVEGVARSKTAGLRIFSSVPVDEPVISLNVRSGCGQKLSRRYVLLADLPHQAAVQASPPVVAPVVRASVAGGTVPPRISIAGALAAPASSGATTAAVKSAVPRLKSKRSELRPGAVLTAAPASAKGKDKAADKPKMRKEPSSGTPRLKLDPTELLSDRIGNIGSFMTFEPSEDALLNMQRMKTLEVELKALREAAAKNERNLMDVKGRLQQAEAERFPRLAVYGLMAAVCLSLMAATWFWSRQRRSSWGGPNAWSAALDEPAVGPGSDAVMGTASRGETRHQAEGWHHAAAHAEIDIPLSFDTHSVQLGESIFSSLVRADVPKSEAGNQPLVESTGVTAKLVRCLSSGAIIDVRRKAQQHIDLRNFDQAIETLERQIAGSDEPNPFVYLDLLKLFHSLNQRREFQKLSQDFNLLFNGRVPDFALFLDQGKGLEDYPEVLARISAMWPTAKVLEFIETCVFRDPWAAASEPFDLAALSELLFLHGLARHLVLATVPAPIGAAAHGSTDSEFDSSTISGTPSQIDFQDSVASTFPEISRSELADLFGPDEEQRPEMLDLDLSALELESLHAPLGATPGKRRSGL